MNSYFVFYPLFLGFNYEFNTLTSTSELAEAYNSFTNAPITASLIIFSILSNYIPYIRKIPADVNKKFNNSCKIIDRVSKQLVEEKYNQAKDNKLNDKDLLSVLININKTLPVEEKMTDDELKHQVIKDEYIYFFLKKERIIYITKLTYLCEHLDYDIFIYGT